MFVFAAHRVEILDGVLKAFHHVADMDVVALEVAFEDHDSAVCHGAPSEVIDQQVEAHARRHAEHGGEAQRHAIAIVEHGLFGFHLCHAIEGDRVQRAFLSAELAALADAIPRIGDREDDLLMPRKKDSFKKMGHTLSDGVKLIIQ